jgi:hypothetical protein
MSRFVVVRSANAGMLHLVHTVTSIVSLGGVIVRPGLTGKAQHVSGTAFLTGRRKVKNRGAAIR